MYNLSWYRVINQILHKWGSQEAKSRQFNKWLKLHLNQMRQLKMLHGGSMAWRKDLTHCSDFLLISSGTISPKKYPHFSFFVFIPLWCNSCWNTAHYFAQCFQVHDKKIYVLLYIDSKEANSCETGSFSIQWIFCQVCSTLLRKSLIANLYYHMAANFCSVNFFAFL